MPICVYVRVCMHTTQAHFYVCACLCVCAHTHTHQGILKQFIELTGLNISGKINNLKYADATVLLVESK